jgi:hypothetical protein
MTSDTLAKIVLAAIIVGALWYAFHLPPSKTPEQIAEGNARVERMVRCLEREGFSREAHERCAKTEW